MPHEIELSKIDPDALRVVQRLVRANHEAYLVGGCVRDLLLGRQPKDFDVATDATPPELRRLFRNCRIIGRRFRLAHIFFGQKIIETSTFRDSPREDDEARPAADTSGPGELAPGDGEPMSDTEAAARMDAASTDAPGADGALSSPTPPRTSADLYIRRDNVFGTAEQDARRRDFTINGLFFDVEKRAVIDHVGGLPDIEARIVRTIGDPDVRFREDPVRILRAVKFAARCDLTIEPETRRRMVEHAGDIRKCAQARVTEELFRLLRAGAARRSMELLVELDLLGVLLPELDAWLRGSPPDAPAVSDLWGLLRGLDEAVAASRAQPSNALLLALLVLPRLRERLASAGGADFQRLADELTEPLFGPLRVSRRESDATRQILTLLRQLLPATGRLPRALRVHSRELRADAELALRALHAAGLLPAEALGLLAAEEGVSVSPREAPADGPRVPGRLHPIPALPSDLRAPFIPPFAGTGRFGPALHGPFATGQD